MKRITQTALFVFMFGGAALAQTATGGLTIENAWSRATASANANGVVYFTVTDTGGPDTLTGATTPIAATAQLHESKTKNGIMEMKTIDTLAIDKDHPIKLAPGGYHLMLEGLKQQLKAGETFPLTLTFAHAGAVSTTVQVQSEATPMGNDKNAMPGMGTMDMGGMDMKGMSH
jgi:copper(I)-binding protein